MLVATREIYGDEVVALLDEAASPSPRSTCSTRRMAGDLIPPPSPAGRPPPDRRASRSRGAARRPPEPTRGRGARRRGREPEPCGQSRRSAARFGFLLGALIGVALAPSALGVVLIGDRAAATDGGPPELVGLEAVDRATTTAAAEQIAEHVGPQYRLDNGNQLVAVAARRLEIARLPLGVAVRAGRAATSSSSRARA